MHYIITDNIHRIRQVCEQQHIQSLFAFGSVCNGKFNDLSDIDLLVSFKSLDYGDYADNYFQTAERFEEIFQRPVDLVTEKSLKNPFFIQTVNQTKVMLYGH